MGRFHLGVDYGTSASKLVLRHFDAPGGERAYLLEPNENFRIPSAVSFDGSYIVLNPSREDALVSLKMKYAGEITGDMAKYYSGESREIPFDLSAGDLVTITVWKLISIGHLSAVKMLGTQEVTMGMTLGVPMSFLDDKTLRSAFLETARIAYQMYRDFGPMGPGRIEVSLAKQLLSEARDSVSKKQPVPESNIRSWIRSEAEASMYWSFRSPATKAECFFCIDIGAGTTDSSAFLIQENYLDRQWIKDGINFFGAHSYPFAMDALQRTRDSAQGISKIRDVLIGSAQEAWPFIKDNRDAVNQWAVPKLIILGGGSFDQNLCHALKAHPMVNFRGTSLDRLRLGLPSDLLRIDGSDSKLADVAFTSVAYGLAQIGQAVPEAARPKEVQPVRRHAVGSLPNHEDIYGN